MPPMSTFVDDQPVDLTGDDLGSLLASARSHLAPSGRVIVDVQIDGEQLTNEQLSDQQAVKTAGREVRLYTADPQTLAVDTLRQVHGRLHEAGQMQQRAAELLQQDQTAEALQQVASAIEIWLQTQQAVQHSSELLSVDLDALTVDNQPLSELTDGLITQLKELKESLNAGDTVGLADALAYEWPQTVERWERLVNALIERIEQPTESAD